MSQLKIFWLMLIPFFLLGQTETYIDQRDQNQYSLIDIAGNSWFGENLKWESKFSHCPNFNRNRNDCKYGNYYPFTELNQVCPIGFHVATIEDWDGYIDYLMSLNKRSPNSIQKDSSFTDFPSLVFKDPLKQLNLIGANNPLNLKDFGWVEGFKKRKYGSATIWIVDEIVLDPKMHIHLGPHNYVQHLHQENISSHNPKLNRKFAVRCVKNKEN